MVCRSHVFMCHSQRVQILCTKLHTLSLVLLLWRANVPLIYSSFISDLELQVLYWTITSVMSIFFSISLFYISGPSLRLYTIVGLEFVAASIFIPVVHGLVVYGLSVQVSRLALPWVIYALIGLTVGTAADAIKVCASAMQCYCADTNYW